MAYPDNCLRGIPNENQVQEDGLVSTDLFFFNEQKVRQTGEFEHSINWVDDPSVIPFTLSQKKSDDSLQFGGGIAMIPRAEIDRTSKLPTLDGALSYDRQPLPENLYHGNLILAAGISKQRRRLIAATLAMLVSEIIPQPTQ